MDESGNALTGAKLKVVDANGKDVVSFTSGAEAYKVNAGRKPRCRTEDRIFTFHLLIYLG